MPSVAHMRRAAIAPARFGARGLGGVEAGTARDYPSDPPAAATGLRNIAIFLEPAVAAICTPFRAGKPVGLYAGAVAREALHRAALKLSPAVKPARLSMATASRRLRSWRSMGFL